MLYEAAQSMLFDSAKSSRHRGVKKAIVAPARRLAVIMHRVWVDGTARPASADVAHPRVRR